LISVIICTYNRDRVFEETVHSFLDCRADGIDYELLLIDNNSTDKTREIGERIAAQIPRVRYMNEPLQGHPNAKNRGIRESRGEIVAFLDDDVYLSPGWLAALASAFGRHVDVACVGGKVTPHFDAGRPSWLEDDLLWIYGVTRYGDQEREIRPPEIPIGCNMAFRRNVFEQIGGFHTSLGRKPGNLLSNDENHFLLCAAKAGLKTLYSPDVQVFHRIPSARTTRQWVLNRHYWQGVSDVAMRQISNDPLPRAALAKRAIRGLIGLLRQWRDMAALLAARSRRGRRVPMKEHTDLCYRLGELRQAFAESLAITGGSPVDSGHRYGNQ